VKGGEEKKEEAAYSNDLFCAKKVQTGEKRGAGKFGGVWRDGDNCIGMRSWSQKGMGLKGFSQQK